MTELYVDLSKAKGMNRYHELVNIIGQVYGDGIVTDNELAGLSKLEQDAEDGYYLAADMLHALNPKDDKYPKLKNVVSYLRTCWRLMDYAVTHGKSDNQNAKKHHQKAEITLPNAQKKKTLDLNLSMEEMCFVLSLRTPEMRREANRDIIAQKVKKMSPKRKKDLEVRITRTMNAMEKEQLTERQMTHLMELQINR